MGKFNKKYFNDGKWIIETIKSSNEPHIHSYEITYNHSYNLKELIDLGNGSNAVIPTIQTKKCDSCNEKKVENINHTFNVSVTERGSYTITCQDEGIVIAQGKVSDL